MDGQNLPPPPPPAGNRPPPPPPRSPQGIGAVSQQPSAPLQPAPYPPPQSATQGGYPAQQAAAPYAQAPAPQIPAQQGQAGYYYGHEGQYYTYQPARTGLPLWAWLTGGGVLLALLAGTVILILVLNGNKVNGVATGGGSGGGGTGGGGANSPRDAAVSFWTNMIQHNYDAARASLAPGNTLSTGQLRQLMEQNEQTNQTTFTSVTAGTESLTGDSGTVPLEMQTANGRTADLTPSVARVDNRWYVADPGFPNLPAQP